MSLFREFFYKKTPDHLVEISERVYVFDCCFSSDVMEEDEYKVYLDGIVAQLHEHYVDASFIVFNFREGEEESQISKVLSQYNMTVTDYPIHYQSLPILPLETISQFLRSSESWLTLEGQQNVVLMHCERSGWPVLDFMLSGLLLNRNKYHAEQKNLEMVYNQTLKETLRLSSTLNPQASQLRYLRYISSRDLGSDWPPSDMPRLLDCLTLSNLPCFQGRTSCRPVLRVYGHDADRKSILLFSTPMTKEHTRLYQQEECIQVKLDIQCCVQGDVVLECLHLDDDFVSEEIVFRIMFHTAFVRSNILTVHRDEMDILWDGSDQYPQEFKAEVYFLRLGSLKPFHWDIVTDVLQGSLWKELQRHGETQTPPEFDVLEIETLFSVPVQKPSDKYGSQRKMVGAHTTEVRLIGKKRAYNAELMLSALRMPVPDIIAAILKMDKSALEIYQIDNLVMFCPTKEEMELLKSFTGDEATLGKCEQFFLELMKVPRVDSKLRVFAFKSQFSTQITKFTKSLNVVITACEEVRSLQKLREEKTNKFSYLRNSLRRGATRDATGFKDLESLKRASEIKLKSLAEEMQAIIKGLEDMNQELAASENDGPVSEVFRETLMDFISIGETEVATVLSLYTIMVKSTEEIVYYAGEDPKYFPFEQVAAALLDCMNFFRQVELKEKRPANKAKMTNWTRARLTRTIDYTRANNTEIMLTQVKMPLPDITAAILAMDDTILDLDQIENFIKFCPNKYEMELLKNYTGDKSALGKCEKYFLELMNVPRVKSKLRVFSFKINFGTQIRELKQNFDVVNSAYEEVCTSQKLKEILKMILYIGNTLNQGTVRGDAMGFKLDSLLNLSVTRAANSKMTLMQYLCKVLASKESNLLEFHKDLESLVPASKIQMKYSLADEMQALIEGMENLNHELTTSENDGPISEVFRELLKDFISIAEPEVASVSKLYSAMRHNADALVYYVNEDPKLFRFEQVIGTLLEFIRLFKKAHEENVEQAELVKAKAAKEAEMEKAQRVRIAKKQLMLNQKVNY